MKSKTKGLIIYAVTAFVIGIPLQIFVDIMSGREVNDLLWPYVLGGFIFSILMTLFKYNSDKRKTCK